MDSEQPTDPDFGANNPEAEAALEALRAAISQPGNVFAPTSSTDQQQHQQPQQQQHSLGTSTLDTHLSSSLSTNQHQLVEKALSALTQIHAGNQVLLDGLTTMTELEAIQENVRFLLDYNKKQSDIVKNLQSSLATSGNPIDPILLDDTVPRAEYESLKAKYDSVLATSATTPAVASGSKTKGKKSIAAGHGHGQSQSATPDRGLNDSNSARKRRSIKLEHLIHKMANRRLGVQYTVKDFECQGTKDLPDPGTVPPTAADSVNGVQEFRPDFRGDVNAQDVQPFISTVIEDCTAAYPQSVGAEEDLDRKKLEEAVGVYWTRLGKRYAEQQARIRGEVHKDELTRRRQNQYRRQQSLLARRQAAFDQSPLNLCKLRGLYRTLLSIDFALPTQERPDPTRSYTEDEWYAYQKLANNGRAPHAHEVVDRPWISSTVRTLLTILDTFAVDQAARVKRKGKPKGPSPIFHLPPQLWDNQSLPTLKPKGPDGLPVTDQPGLVLFKFHVSQEIQDANPEWAQGLYDNPPIPDSDAMLPALDEIVNSGPYIHLKPRVRRALDEADVKLLTSEEVKEVLARPIPPEDPFPIPDPDAAARDLTAAEEFMSQNLESFEALANNPLAFPDGPASASAAVGSGSTDGNAGSGNGTGAGGGLLNGLGGAGTAFVGPSPGSSVRARRQNKRLASQTGYLGGPGAVVPVPKRAKTEENGNATEVEAGAEAEGDRDGGEVEVDLDRDADFLQTLK